MTDHAGQGGVAMEGREDVIRYRIMAVAVKHFNRRSFGRMQLSDISRDLNVDRAVVRRYFKTVEDILNTVIDSFFRDIEDILQVFVDDVFIPAVRSGELQIRKDRLHFANPQGAAVFNGKLIDHFEALYDYLLVHSGECSLLVKESLVSGAHHGCMERLLSLFLPIPTNPLYQKIKAAAKIHLAPEIQTNILQTYILPILSYITFKENLDQLVNHDQETYKQNLLSEIRAGNARHIIGQDIFYAAI